MSRGDPRDAFEVNFDGLVGPTHNYAGLSPGNLASTAHRREVSSPKRAALEGLAKLKRLADLGVKQAVLPPQSRPDVGLLRRMGFVGSDAKVLAQASQDAPHLLAAAYSASSMWAANAATVSPSADCADRRVHFTPANLISTLHRSIEANITSHVLREIFPDESVFAHHDPLPATAALGDEGAANHMRLCKAFGEQGVEVFVYGTDHRGRPGMGPSIYPARQSRLASEAIARLHGLDVSRAVFLQQHPDAIDAGVFHNDVIALSHQNVLIYHEQAFAESDAAVEAVRRAFEMTCACELVGVEVKRAEVSLKDAVSSYLFNSQLVTLEDETMLLVCPGECEQCPATHRWIGRLVEADGNPIGSVQFVDLRQSMNNGGGPACLRLRVVLTGEELDRTLPNVLLTDSLYQRLVQWVETYHRDELSPGDLADPRLAEASHAAMSELGHILGLQEVRPM